jgi:hypothetical protein
MGSDIRQRSLSCAGTSSSLEISTPTSSRRKSFSILDGARDEFHAGMSMSLDVSAFMKSSKHSLHTSSSIIGGALDEPPRGISCDALTVSAILINAPTRSRRSSVSIESDDKKDLGKVDHAETSAAVSLFVKPQFENDVSGANRSKSASDAMSSTRSRMTPDLVDISTKDHHLMYQYNRQNFSRERGDLDGYHRDHPFLQSKSMSHTRMRQTPNQSVHQRQVSAVIKGLAGVEISKPVSIRN